MIRDVPSNELNLLLWQRLVSPVCPISKLQQAYFFFTNVKLCYHLIFNAAEGQQSKLTEAIIKQVITDLQKVRTIYSSSFLNLLWQRKEI